jgi:hypothetical protein
VVFGNDQSGDRMIVLLAALDWGAHQDAATIVQIPGSLH